MCYDSENIIIEMIILQYNRWQQSTRFIDFTLQADSTAFS